jgi:hypothetical protein
MAREGARIAAICGASLPPPATPLDMPNGQQCNDNNINNYITSHLVGVPAGITPAIYVCAATSGSSCTQSSGNLGSGFEACEGQAGSLVEVVMSYHQPLFLPLVSNVFATNPDGTRTIKASAQATCE